MPVVNDLLVGAAHLAVRNLVQRQDASTDQTTTFSATINVPAATTTTLPDATDTMASNSDDNPQSQPTSSPLLFFVALGFGVVFTNLWIIVGVKYCFRYNARNRALRMAEDGEPINMENMPRPHRRRREKKLMTMDEVNEKFPMQKYKNWVASRAQEGLPTAGGVSVPPSRANSIREADGVVPEISKERESTDERPTTSATNRANAVDTKEKPQQDKEDGPATASSPANGDSSGTNVTPDSNVKPDDASHRDDDDDEDDQINAALPPECLGTSGDTCAICIDTLEDDDDVRGLTCGHAFHAGCLDPWLTSRRACCPLCKADYYTPKPRRTHTNTNAELPAPPADGSPAADASGNPSQAASRIESRRTDHRMNLPQPPQTAWQSVLARGRGMLPGRGQDSPTTRSAANRQRRVNGAGARPPRSTPSRTSATPATPTTQASPTPQAPSAWHRFREAFPHFQLQNRNNPSAATVTPGQLESGVRS